MLLTVTTGSYWPRSTSEALDHLLDAEVEDIELTLQANEFYQTYTGEFRYDLTGRLVELIGSERLFVDTLHAPAIAADHLHSTRARVAYLRRCLRLCGEIGCRYLVVHPFHLFGSYELAQAYLAGEASVWDALLPDLRSVLKEAEVTGLTLCLENIEVWGHDTTHFFNSPANVKRLMTDVDSPVLGVTLDVMHAQFAHALPDFISELRDWIITAHLADLVRPAQRVPPGQGEIDWPAVLAALEALPRMTYAALEMALATPVAIQSSLEFLEQHRRRRFLPR
jgi:sugar phosphate isomerase/epimerase